MAGKTAARPPTPRSISIAAPAGFDLSRAVQGHGWFDLPPFRWDPGARRLSFALRLPGAGPVAASLRAGGAEPRGGQRLLLEVLAGGPLSTADAAAAGRGAAHVLRLDEDLSPFYRRAEEVPRPDLRWAGPAGAGRLLRCPTVFEDLVKMVATTNCSWALTRVIVAALVERLGEPLPGGGSAFPTPAAMAAARPAFYRDTARAGYRAEALRGLASDVALGRLDPESWLDPARPVEEIREAILALRGAGPYVADNMLKLLGRYEGLGIDAWCRRKFSLMYHRGRRVSDRTIARFYAPFGAWRGLALWCDITRDWFEEGTLQEKFTEAAY
ncbi:MAG TPA: Fe-S cluster assembly protein HesB [Candidatus Polarisedimenticolia bacterium]|nr:Fe-S cluster assembly protein HesB [Candidatus Polarisedimenticolia bacterium]